MNIAVFIKKTTFHKGYGGLETQNKALCEGLVKRGHHVTVFSPKYDLESATDVLNGASYVFVDCSYRSLAGFGHLDKNNWINRSVEALKKRHYDVPYNLVLAQSSAGLGIIRNKEELNIPVVSISHGSTIGEFRTVLQSLGTLKDFVMLVPKFAYVLLNFFGRQREFVLHSDRIIAVSNYVKKAIVDETFVFAGKVTVVYNGIDEKLHLAQRKGDSVKVFYVGLIHWSKGLGDLIEAFKRLNNPQVGLRIIGDGEHLERLKKEVASKGLAKQVEILGRTTHEEAMEVMRESNIFVLPSRRVEGFPMTIPEAMFAGLPVIGSDMGGIPEGIDDGETGLVYKAGDVKQLVSALKRLSDNKEEREKMGEAAITKAQREYTVDVMLDGYEKVIGEVLR